MRKFLRELHEHFSLLKIPILIKITQNLKYPNRPYSNIEHPLGFQNAKATNSLNTTANTILYSGLTCEVLICVNYGRCHGLTNIKSIQLLSTQRLATLVTVLYLMICLTYMPQSTYFPRYMSHLHYWVLPLHIATAK